MLLTVDKVFRITGIADLLLTTGAGCVFDGEGTEYALLMNSHNSGKLRSLMNRSDNLIASISDDKVRIGIDADFSDDDSTVFASLL